jgi:hypothetical protein
MRLAAPLGASSIAVFVAFLAVSAPAAAAQKSITGKLSKRGYVVIAVAANGEGKTAQATPKFSLRPPAKAVTLHLRGPDGVYVGPIVITSSTNGKRIVLGVKAGTRLGDIKINARKGYAFVENTPAKGRLDPRRFARAKNGIPLGAGNFGLVRSKPPGNSPPGDRDADGVANRLDIDTDGDRVLDRYERAGAVRAAARVLVYGLVTAVNDNGTVRARPCPPLVGPETTGPWPSDAPTPIVGMSYLFDIDLQGTTVVSFNSASGPIQEGCPLIAYLPNVGPALALNLRETVNVNAGATVSDLDRILSERGVLVLLASGSPDVRIELDCGGSNQNPPRLTGLKYCSRGGTGRASRSLIGDGLPRSFPLVFPECCDSFPSGGNGFGELAPLATDMGAQGPQVQARLSHGATTDEVGTGDVLNWRITPSGGSERQFPTTLPDVFATVPALVSYDDDGPAGDPPTRVNYPVPAPYVGSPPNFEAGEQGPYKGFPVDPCPAGAPPPCVEGEVVLTLEFWRPQREAIGDEAGAWTDIGGLVYAPGVAVPSSGPIALPRCEDGQVSTTDPNLTRARANFPYGYGAGFRDKAPDRPTDPANRLTYSVNVTRCRGSLNSGDNVLMWLTSGLGDNLVAGGNSATQRVTFTVK